MVDEELRRRRVLSHSWCGAVRDRETAPPTQSLAAGPVASGLTSVNHTITVLSMEKGQLDGREGAGPFGVSLEVGLYSVAYATIPCRFLST